MRFQLNIDRLHHCVEALNKRKWLDRGEGATTARLHLLLGDVVLGDPYNVYVFVTENECMVDITSRYFSEMLREYEVEINTRTKERIITSNGTVVRFMSAHIFFNTHSLRGLNIARVYFDVSQYALRPFDDEQINYTLSMITCRGADVV